MPYEKIHQNKILDLLADQKKTIRALSVMWLSGFISDEKMLELLKKLSTIYKQFDLTEKIPIVKYN